MTSLELTEFHSTRKVPLRYDRYVALVSSQGEFRYLSYARNGASELRENIRISVDICNNLYIYLCHNKPGFLSRVSSLRVQRIYSSHLHRRWNLVT